MIITNIGSTNIKARVVGRLFNRAIVSSDDLFATQWRCQPTITASALLPRHAKKHSIHESSVPINAQSRKCGDKRSVLNDSIPVNQYGQSRLHSDSTNIEFEGREKEDEEHGLTEQERSDANSPLLRSRKEVPVWAVHSKPDDRNTKKSEFLQPKVVVKRKRQRKEVTFAGFPTLILKSDRIDRALCLGFLDAVTVFDIPPISDYSTEDRENIWYTRDEEQSMKYHAYKERILQTNQSPNREKISTISTKATSGKRCINHHHLRAEHKRTALDIVLQEQYRQRVICRKIYGKIIPRTSGNNYSSGIIDPERIRQVYRTLGKTIKSQKAAEARAQICRLEELHDNNFIFNEDDVNENVDDATQIIYSDNYDHEDLEVDVEVYAKPTFCFQCYSNTSMVFHDCIDCVFNALLAHFLEIRTGAIFLDTEDEMVVTMLPPSESPI